MQTWQHQRNRSAFFAVAGCLLLACLNLQSMFTALESLARLCHLCCQVLCCCCCCVVACLWSCCPVSSSSRNEVTILLLAGAHQPLCASTVPLSLPPPPVIAPSQTHFLFDFQVSHPRSKGKAALKLPVAHYSPQRIGRSTASTMFAVRRLHALLLWTRP